MLPTPQTSLQRAQLLYHQGRYDLASNALHELLAMDPNNAPAHALLGLCHVEQKKYEEATAETQAAVHHEPDSPFAHYAMGFVYHQRNRFPEAQAAAEEALRLAPEDPDYWALLAQSQFSQSRWREALDAANHGLQADPDHIPCNNLRAMAMVQLGEKQAASQSIADALRRNPHSAATHASQGWAMLHQNDVKKALEHFRESLRLNPENPWARQGMMEALKARHLLYRIMLRYYLWMSRFSKRGQWGIVIGAWIGIEVLKAVRTANPALAPFIYPLLVAYGLFVLASWLFQPMFDLTLLFNRFGRYLLNKTQFIAAILVGSLLLSGFALILAWLAVGNGLALGVGILLVALSLSTAATAKCRFPAILIMSAYTVVAAAIGLTAIFQIENDNPNGANLFLIAILACALSSIAANISATIVHKK
jgi:tetratricopeptide (TPR) repeat protein